MICVFIQLRCRPGRTYEVADAIYDLEFASELYSTSGEYDLMMKVYIPEGDRHRPLHQREAPRHPAPRPQPDDADLQGVLMIARLGRRLRQRAAHPGRRRLSAALGGGGAGVPRAAWAGGCARASPTGRIRGSGSTSSCRRRTPAGLVVFVHGGYWRAFDRGDWSHLAAGPLARGWAVAMPGYVLAPEARIAAITAMIREAVAAAAGEVAGPIRLAGHSAGGHLVARQLCADSRLPEAVLARVERVVPISGLYDLRPLLRLAAQRDAAARPAGGAAESPALLEVRRGGAGARLGRGRRAAGVRAAERAARQRLDRARGRHAR